MNRLRQETCSCHCGNQERGGLTGPAAPVQQGPEDGESWLWPCCRGCPHRGTCPYAYDQLLSQMALQGRAAARSLRGEADRLQRTISGAAGVGPLLDGNWELERALNRALGAELTLIGRLCAPWTDTCP